MGGANNLHSKSADFYNKSVLRFPCPLRKLQFVDIGFYIRLLLLLLSCLKFRIEQAFKFNLSVFIKSDRRRIWLITEQLTIKYLSRKLTFLPWYIQTLCHKVYGGHKIVSILLISAICICKQILLWYFQSAIYERMNIITVFKLNNCCKQLLRSVATRFATTVENNRHSYQCNFETLLAHKVKRHKIKIVI